MFGLGVPELIVILVVVLFIFGPRKLPELGTFVGRSLKDFREALDQRSDSEESQAAPEPATRNPEGHPEFHPEASDTVTTDESTVQAKSEKNET
jgi:sec-independent protein translocase protein TatA